MGQERASEGGEGVKKKACEKNRDERKEEEQTE
jgi:hypothetical protein